MKANKLYKDVRPEEQPKETYPFGKNGIQFDLSGASFNEPGFRRLQVLAPYKIHGIIGSDKKMIVFSTDNTNSAVGFFDPETESYQPIIDDGNPSWTFGKIGFKAENYITGESQRNYKGEVVTTFTDKVLFPMYLNCDNPNIRSLDDLRLFAFFRTPDIESQETIGGNLPEGAYFVAIGYERNDGTSTPYSAVSEVTIITPSATGGSTDKALTFSIKNADTSYDFVRVAIISKVNGVTRAVELLDYLPVTGGDIEFTYTGDQLTQDVDVASILVKPTVYSQVGAIGQLNDYLFLGNLEIEPDLNDMQPYAASVNIEFQSELINATAPPADHINGKKRSLMHEEVYAIYIRYRKVRGGFTKWFTIPGPSPKPADLAPSSEAVSGGEPTPIPKFKVEDTIPYFDAVQKTGGFGVWENETEKYPDTEDFNASTIGGRNFRNQAVLHHKTPSLKWCKQNFYSTHAPYGVTDLDLLGIRAKNVRIPDKYTGVIDGYEIGYARRTVSNMTNYGQSVLMHGVVNAFDQGKPTGGSVGGSGAATIYTSGGNWRTSIWHKGDNSFNNNFELVQLRMDTFRFHAFDVLLNKPSIEPTFISSQYKLIRNNLRTEGYIEDGQNNANFPTAFLVDYTLGTMTNVSQTGQKLRKVKESTYMPNGINTLSFVNARHEATFAGTLAGTNWPMNYGDAGLRVKGESFTEANVGCPPFEETYLVNLISVKSELYSRFYSQTMVSMGQPKELSSTEVFWGGDTFLCDYTFHTYGRHETNDGWGDGNKGKKVIRRFVCESASNIHLRYEIIGNQYSKWYPKEPVALNVENNTTYIINFDRAQDPNQFGYSKSLNSLNDLIDSTIYNPFREELTKFPYRIHRGGRLVRTGRPRSWRTFLPLDYHEMQKNMGFIVNLEGMDDRLLIHMENSLFITQNKAVLKGDQIDVTLGSGDIFQFEPQEVISSKLGHAGTQHDLACVRTPIGYVFIDAKQGEIYLYKSNNLDMLNPGLNIFLRQYLKIKGKNVFFGNGLTIGWDQKYKRFLFTVKNRTLTSNVVVKDYEDTAEFWDNLQIGDIVYYMNRYVKYEGVNNPGVSGVDCTPIPPKPVTTWEPMTPYCLTDENGKNTGIQGWTTRRRLINGVPDAYTEPNLPNVGQGIYFPPIQNEAMCPIPQPVITWEGTNPYCIRGTGITCEDGWTLSEDKTYCFKETSTPATPPSGGGGTPGIAAEASSNEWNNGGARIYDSGFSVDGTGTNTLVETPHIWVNGTSPFNSGTRNLVDSRMNYAGLWVQGGMSGGVWTPINEWIGFARKITVSATKTIYIGMCADNNFRVKLNGNMVVENLDDNNFNYMHIYPVELKAGDNFIEMYALNKGSVAGFAMEIYDASKTQLQGATSNAQIDGWLIFSTKDMVGEPFDLGTTIGWSCPPGYSLDTSGTGDPVCRKIDTVPPDVAPENNTGEKGFYTRCRKKDGVLDGFCEDNTETGGQGPYIPPVEDLTTCPTTPPEPPEPIQITGTVERFCSDKGCSEQGGISLKFTFSEPLPTNLELYAGQIIRINWSGERQYSGSEIFTPPAGVNPWTYYDPVTSPFTLTIPAGITTFTVPEVIYTRDQHVSGQPMGWICHNCMFPLTDIYFKINTPATGYELNLTSATTGVTIHNQN